MDLLFRLSVFIDPVSPTSHSILRIIQLSILLGHVFISYRLTSQYSHPCIIMQNIWTTALKYVSKSYSPKNNAFTFIFYLINLMNSYVLFDSVTFLYSHVCSKRLYLQVLVLPIFCFVTYIIESK